MSKEKIIKTTTAMSTNAMTARPLVPRSCRPEGYLGAETIMGGERLAVKNRPDNVARLGLVRLKKDKDEYGQTMD